MRSLRSWLARRLLLGLAQTVAVVLLVFALTEVLPGDAAVALAGDDPDPRRIEQIRAAMDLDRPALERLADWTGGLLRGDFGTSLASGRPVADYLSAGFGPTLVLAALTVALLVPISVGLGVLAARREGGALDRLVSLVTLGVYAVPEFAFGVLLVTVFALRLDWLPPTAVGYGTDLLAHPAVLVLSVLVLLSRPVCSISRLVRAGMIDALAAPYAAQARRYGVSGARVCYAPTRCPTPWRPRPSNWPVPSTGCCAASSSWRRCSSSPGSARCSSTRSPPATFRWCRASR